MLHLWKSKVSDAILRGLDFAGFQQGSFSTWSETMFPRELVLDDFDQSLSLEMYISIFNFVTIVYLSWIVR